MNMNNEYQNKRNRKEYHRKYYLANKKWISKKNKRYRLIHIEEIRKRQRKYAVIYRVRRKTIYNSPKNKYQSYKHDAERRNIKWNLSFNQFMTFWQKPCHYCGEPIEFIGLDRVDNSKEYTINNIVPCCKICNRMKSAYSKDEFIDYCIKIARRFGN